jgi:hypothetical protein
MERAVDIQTLQTELLNQRNINTQLPNLGTSAEGYPFTRHPNDVTVCFGPNGGAIVPAARSYPDASEAAVYTDVYFQKNHAGDFKSGHRSGIVGTDWRCDDLQCRCQGETYDERFRRSVFTGRRA